MRRTRRMAAADRKKQVLGIAAEEFAHHGLHGASTEHIAHQAEITQAYVFRLFGTKRALFLTAVVDAFDRMTNGMRAAAANEEGRAALALMGARYNDMLADRTLLLLQLQGFAACGDPEVLNAMRGAFGRMWQMLADRTGLDTVTIKAFLAFGMLLNSGAALRVSELDEPWAQGVRTRIQAGLFDHITTETNR